MAWGVGRARVGRAGGYEVFDLEAGLYLAGIKDCALAQFKAQESGGWRNT